MVAVRSIVSGVSVRGLVLAIAAALALSGCRQADGPIPMPEGENSNKVQDIARDLQNLAEGQPDAAMDLLYDLDGFPGTRPAAMIRRLAASLSQALRMKFVQPAQAQELARLMFVTVTAEELSPRQIDQLGMDVQAATTAIGSNAEDAAQVAGAATALQSAITLNRKRWYHVF